MAQHLETDASEFINRLRNNSQHDSIQNVFDKVHSEYKFKGNLEGN